jgi:uncharacterized membrane protein YhaH (DUF805 family)
MGIGTSDYSGLIFVLVASITITVGAVYAYAWAKIFDDAGEPWWAVFIPPYAIVCALRAAGYSGWWAAVLLFVPFANIVLMYVILFSMAEQYGKSRWGKVGIVLLPIIFLPLATAESL